MLPHCLQQNTKLSQQSFKMSSLVGKKPALISNSFNHGVICFNIMLLPSYLDEEFTFSHSNAAFQTADSFMRVQYKPKECSFLPGSRYLLRLNIHSDLKV